MASLHNIDQVQQSKRTGFVLITRFSLRIVSFLSMANVKSEESRDEWFRQRSRLFMAMTYPSVCSQEILPDRWYLLVSEGDQRLVNECLKMTEDWIVPIYVNGGNFEALNTALYEAIMIDFAHFENLLISRVDNDDALNRKFVAQLYNVANATAPSSDKYILFKNGLRWDGELGEVLSYLNGPFLTMYSRDWRRTRPNPLLINHTKVLDYPHLVAETDEPMWMQLIHGKNLSNKFLKKAKLTPRSLKDIIRTYGIGSHAVEVLKIYLDEISTKDGVKTSTQPGDLRERAMDILIIGGNNSMLSNGIATQLPALMQAAGFDIASANNISVAGTGSLHGLENLINFDGCQPNLVVIEYGINDLPTYTRDKDLWECGFASLLRCARSRYPDALVVTLLLGRREEKFLDDQRRMHLDMTRLSMQYGAKVVDIVSELKNEKFRKLPLESFYQDESHFRDPLVAGYISQKFAISIMGMIRAGSSPVPATANDSKCKNTKMELTSIPGEAINFSSSRFNRNAAFLAKDQSVLLTVSGAVVGISFVSAPFSCSVRVDLPTFSIIVNTLHRSVDAGENEFIVKHVPLLGAFERGMIGSESVPVRLTAIDASSPLWDESLVQKNYGMIEPGPQTTGLNMCFISSLVAGES